MTVSIRKTRKLAVIKVEDSGIGIPRNRLDDVFKSFFQVDSTRKRSYKGVGLGLSICKSIVELHGGEILVFSRVNKGTSVSVRLPL